MEAILLQILDDASTVILPHFGAIIKLGEVYQFNEFLKYNDGKLIKAVAKNKQVDEEQATILVSDFIRDIKEHLNANKDYSLGKIGVLTKKGEKVVIAKVSNAERVKKENTPSQKTATKESSEIKIAPVKKEKEENPKTKIIKETDKTETPKKEVNPKINTSSNLVIDVAIEKIKKIKNLDELANFTVVEKRESVLKTIELVKQSLTQPAEKKTKEVVPSLSSTSVAKDDKKETKKETKKEIEQKEVKITKTETQKEVEKKDEKTTVEKKLDAPKKAVTSKVTAKTTESSKEKKEVDKAPKKETIDPKIEKELMEGAIVIEQEAKKRKRNKIILYVAILFLLFGISILGYLKLDSIKGLFSGTDKELAEHKAEQEVYKTNNSSHHDVVNEKEQYTGEQESAEEKEHVEEHIENVVEEDVANEETTNESKDEVVDESPEEEEASTEEEPEQEIEEPKVTTNGRYNIVVGSFSKEENASNLVQTLKEKGYSNARVLARSGSLYPVSIGNYMSRSEAKTALKEIKDAGYKGWIKKI